MLSGSASHVLRFHHLEGVCFVNNIPSSLLTESIAGYHYPSSSLSLISSLSTMPRCLCEILCRRRDSEHRFCEKASSTPPVPSSRERQFWLRQLIRQLTYRHFISFCIAQPQINYSKPLRLRYRTYSIQPCVYYTRPESRLPTCDDSVAPDAADPLSPIPTRGHSLLEVDQLATSVGLRESQRKVYRGQLTKDRREKNRKSIKAYAGRWFQPIALGVFLISSFL